LVGEVQKVRTSEEGKRLVQRVVQVLLGVHIRNTLGDIVVAEINEVGLIIETGPQDGGEVRVMGSVLDREPRCPFLYAPGLEFIFAIPLRASLRHEILQQCIIVKNSTHIPDNTAIAAAWE
jgi:hypothetical protein